MNEAHCLNQQFSKFLVSGFITLTTPNNFCLCQLYLLIITILEIKTKNYKTFNLFKNNNKSIVT